MKISVNIIAILLMGYSLIMLAKQCNSVRDENMNVDDKCINGYVWSLIIIKNDYILLEGN